jgi:uncharacterized protein
MVTDLDRIARLLDESGDRENPTAEELRELVGKLSSAAVVGLSRDTRKAARRVPSYLAANGIELFPVNPNADRILGRVAVDRLDQVTRPVDLVLVFRPSAEAGEIIRSAMDRNERPVIWLQQGIRSDEEAARARKAGRTVIQDLCIFRVHRSLDENLPAPPTERDLPPGA